MDCAYQEKRLDKKQKLHSGIKKVNISGAWKRGIGIVNMPMSVNYVFAVYNCKQQEKYPEEYVCQRTAVNSFKREVLSPHSGIVQFAFSDYYDVEKYKINAFLAGMQAECSDSNSEYESYLPEMHRLEMRTMLILHGSEDCSFDKYKGIVKNEYNFPQKLIERVAGLYFYDEDSITSSAEDNYNLGKENNYMEARGKSGKKLILGTWKQNSEGRAAIGRADEKTKDLKEITPPYLYTKTWAASVNDAFIGGGIDAGARFKIYDISQNAQDKICEIQLDTDLSKREQSFFEYCKESGDKNLYDADGDFQYTVLAREIGQLLNSGYYFEKIQKKSGGTNFQAFRNKDEYDQYLRSRVS